MSRRLRPTRISMEEMHRALSKVESVAWGKEGHNDSLHRRPDKEDAAPELKKLEAVSSTGSTGFDDAIHEYAIFARPTNTGDVENLVELVVRLAKLCDSNAHDWKVFMLLAFRRRFHAKAPTAQEILKANENDEKNSDAVDGDGERLIFYVTCLGLHRYLRILEATKSGDEKHTAFTNSAVKCMIAIAPNLGGTRDVNAMIEHLCFEFLLDLGHASLESPAPEAPTSFKNKLVPVFNELLRRESPLSDSALDQVLDVAASLLNNDLNKCKDSHASTEEKNTDDLMSTIHVTLPHNNRGCSKGKSWQRNMVNSIAEILIWQRTNVATTDDRFVTALNELKRLAPDSVSDGHDCLLRMQTTARKRRKLLNDRAREEGFMLSSLYLMDKGAVSLRLIRRAKAGDLAMLTKLAKKNRDERTLKMILKRNFDPSKATPVESIDALVNGWIDIRSKEDEQEGTVEALELQLQDNTVRVTVSKLQSMLKREDPRPVLVVNIGHDRRNQACAVLVASVFGDNARLIINSKEHIVNAHEETMKVLNSVIHEEGLGGEDDKTLEDILEAGVKESQDVIVLSSHDIELDEAVLQSLQEKDVRIRVHSTHKVIVSGEDSVEVNLNTEIHNRLKTGAPITLTVMLDCTGSMGGEIEGCKKGAMTLIRTFRDLAPVKTANFLGYWDPISSRGDPEPRSTGFLEPNKENLEKIQTFVNTKLRCTGGGDEPEDIPAALKKLLEDIKTAGISADDGAVHFCFFIADAGFRPNAQADVMRSLEELKKLGIVMVMCPVRAYGTCQTMVAKSAEIFKGAGQYIELGGVGQLTSIAATVTESIRASLFQSSNVVSVAASVGQTLDTIGQLCGFQRDHEALKKVEKLAKEPEVKEAEDEEEVAVDETPAEEPTVEKKPAVFATRNEYKLTSRDRLFLQLSRLPPICHEVVEGGFGGKSLAEQTASVIADRMLDGNIPIVALQKAGYPPDVVKLVRQVMGGHGRPRTQQ